MPEGKLSFMEGDKCSCVDKGHPFCLSILGFVPPQTTGTDVAVVISVFGYCASGVE
jgi:hypothetical protein